MSETGYNRFRLPDRPLMFAVSTHQIERSSADSRPKIYLTAVAVSEVFLFEVLPIDKWDAFFDELLAHLHRRLTGPDRDLYRIMSAEQRIDLLELPGDETAKILKVVRGAA